MPFPNEIAARQRDPKRYETFKRVNKDKGVSIIFGILPDGKLEIQSVRFNAALFTAASAKQWLRENDMKQDIEEAKTDSEDDLEEWRFDRGQASKLRIDSQGFGHFEEATLTTVGVYKYRRKDGSVRRELRPASEVQSQRFLESLRNCVVTDEHPHPRGTAVNARNFRRFAIGSTGTDVRANGLRVDSSLAVRDLGVTKRVLERRERGLPTGVSVGYRCKTRKESGVWHGPNGPEEYDYVQFGHVANHVAITTAPRGGLGNGGTTLHLDSLEAEQIIEDDNSMETTKVDIGGVMVDVLAAHAPLLQDKLNKLDSDLQTAKDANTELAGKLGEAEGKVTELEEANEKLKLDSEVDLGALIAERQKLLDDASKIVPQAELDKLDSSANDFNEQVVTLVLDSRDISIPEGLEGDAAKVYCQARFDSLVESAGKDAHKRLSGAVANGGKRTVFKTDSDHEALNERLKKAQEKRDNPYASA